MIQFYENIIGYGRRIAFFVLFSVNMTFSESSLSEIYSNNFPTIQASYVNLYQILNIVYQNRAK